MASQNIARLGIVLGVDSGELVSKITEAQQKFGDFKRQIKRDSEDAAKEIVRLEAATRNYGKSLTELEKIEEQIRLGKYKNQPDVLINSLKAQAAAYDKVAASAKMAEQAKMKQAGGLTAQQQAALGYQTTDIITSLAGGQNPLMVLLQQGGQLKDQFGGFKPMFAGIAEALTPVKLAVGGIAGVLGTLGFAFYQGAEESKKFQNSLVLTGQFAGMSQARFEGLAKTIREDYGIAISQSREVMQQLVSSGQFTYKSLQSVADVIAKIASLSGESASDVASKLIPSFDGSAASAKKLNEQYHFLTIEQYKHIEALNLEGKAQEAAKYTADALNAKLKTQQEYLGYIEQAWKGVKNAASDFWDWLKSIGRQEDPLVAAIKNEMDMMETLTRQLGANASKSPLYQKALENYKEFAAQMEAQEKERQKKSDKAAKDELNIKDHSGAGGAETSRKLAQERAKLIADINYQTAAEGLDRIGALYAEYQKKVSDINTKLANESPEKKRAFGWEMEKNAVWETIKAYEEYETKARAISDEQNKKWTEKTAQEQDTLARERERLDFLRENLFATKEQIDLDNSRIKTMQELAALDRERNMLPEAKAIQEKRIVALGEEREALIRQQEELTRLQNINQTVFSNMGSAIDTFVKTGKLSFADLTKSIIQDLIAIQLKAQAVAMFSSLMGALGFGGKYTPGSSSFVGPMPQVPVVASAVGGPLNAGQTSIVGENGPELFVPRTAGTIVPNSGDLRGLNMGTTNVTNNYIDAIDVKSFEQRLLGSSNTIWAANQYANKSLAAVGGRS